MTEPTEPQVPGLMELFDAAPMWTRVLLVVAVIGVTLAILAWVFGFWDFDDPEPDVEATVSQVCLDHFELSERARDNVPTRSPSSVVWVGVDMRDAFFDCDSLAGWNIAAAAYPGALGDNTEVEKFVRRSCEQSGELAGSPTCTSLD